MARFHRETKKKNQFKVCVRQTDGQTESTKNNRFLARREDQYSLYSFQHVLTHLHKLVGRNKS